MSHFCVLVIGDEPEVQLAPFHEFECTGTNDQYVQDVDVTAESKEHGLDYYGLDDKVVASECAVDREGVHKYGYAIMQDGQLIKAVNRTNPNKQWDWYQIGGRWNGFFTLKTGAQGVVGAPGLQKMDDDYAPPSVGKADQCAKGDVDFDAMRKEAVERATEKYDLFVRVTQDCPPIVPWETIRAKHGDAIDAARQEYHAQAAVATLQANKETIWFAADDFACTRDEFVERARKAAVVTFAVVKDGKWYERGNMGWWGCVSNEKNEDEWNDQFYSLLDGLSDDTLLTLVDCHI